jgi:hypothetical protein
MKSSIIYKKIKKGNIAKIVKSKTLRDDIPCGATQCIDCDRNNNILSLSNPVLILDANLIMEQIDALENLDMISNIVVPQSEYIYLNETNPQIFAKFNLIVDNRNIYIFP